MIRSAPSSSRFLRTVAVLLLTVSCQQVADIGAEGSRAWVMATVRHKDGAPVVGATVDFAVSFDARCGTPPFLRARTRPLLTALSDSTGRVSTEVIADGFGPSPRCLLAMVLGDTLSTDSARFRIQSDRRIDTTRVMITVRD